MFVGGIALRDGEERGETGFGSEVVVMVGEQGVVLRIVAYGENIELGVVELGEVGLRNEAVDLGGQCRDVGLPRLQEGVQEALDDVKAGDEVARVAGRDEEVGQGVERFYTVPVVEVAVPFLKSFDGVYNVSYSHHCLFLGDEIQFGSRYDGSHRIAYVCRAGLVVGLLLAVQLVVVRYQPVAFLGDEAVEEVPRILGQLAYLPRLLLVEGFLVLRKLPAQPVHQHRCQHPNQAGEACGNGSHDVACVEDATIVKHPDCQSGQCYCTDIVKPEFPQVVAQSSLGALGGLVARNPRQKVAMRDPHSPTGPQRRVAIHPGFLGQEGELDHGAVDDDLEAAHERHVIFVALAE